MNVFHAFKIVQVVPNYAKRLSSLSLQILSFSLKIVQAIMLKTVSASNFLMALLTILAF